MDSITAYVTNFDQALKTKFDDKISNYAKMFPKGVEIDLHNKTRFWLGALQYVARHLK